MQAVDTVELIDSIIRELDGCIQKLGIDAYCKKLRDLDHWRRHAATHAGLLRRIQPRQVQHHQCSGRHRHLSHERPARNRAVPAILEYGSELTARIEYLKNPPTSL